MKLNILITGGAGYIGSHVANLLIDKGYEVTIIDNLITGNLSLVPKKAKLEKCDISDKKKVSKILKKKNFAAILHFAGLIRVDESVKKPIKYKNYNYNKAKIFFETCLKNNVNKIIFSSTASVYGNANIKSVKEDDKLQPLNPYAASKLKFEKYLIKKSNITNMTYIILRYFNVAGADKKLRTGLISKYSTHLIKVACEVATKKRKKIIINGDNYNTKDGTPVRDYIHVSDLSEIHLISLNHLLKGGKSEIFNCGYGKGYSVKEVIREMNKIVKEKINTEIGLRRKGDSQKIVANISKLKNYFSWKPKNYKLSKILKSSLDWERKIVSFNNE